MTRLPARIEAHGAVRARLNRPVAPHRANTCDTPQQRVIALALIQASNRAVVAR
jgi:hypothetical protein